MTITDLREVLFLVALFLAAVAFACLTAEGRSRLQAIGVALGVAAFLLLYFSEGTSP